MPVFKPGLVLFLIVITYPVNGLCQCIADAGIDTTICLTSSFTPFQIGGNPTASGGAGSYLYTWTLFSEGQSLASDLLDDTTLANPTVLQAVYGKIVFHLQVIDANGNICFDSVAIYFSNWTCITGECFFTIAAG